MNKVIIISGPTASGKSSIAVNLAKELNTEVISCDSMQIYKHMNIGTAKITENEMKGVKHHMIDVVEPNQNYSVSDYSSAAMSIISDLHRKNIVPIICGGTGLYIDSLLFPLTLGAKDDELRHELELELEEKGPDYMHEQLALIDPAEALKVHKNNVKRVLRALEIYRLTGKTKSEYDDRDKKMNYEVLLICLNPDREKLYDNINARVDNMFTNGLTDEVLKLLSNGISFDMQSMQAIGYKEFKDYFDKKLTMLELKDLIKKETRHYAKRQITWLKRYSFANWCEINDINKINTLVSNFMRNENEI